MSVKKESKIITKITILAFVFNVILLITKILLGIFGNSRALMVGAIDSGLDILATFVILFVGRFSRKKEDKSHPYGHEKFESIIAIVLAVIMIFAAIQIGYLGVNRIIDYFKGIEEIIKPNYLAIIGVGITIFIKIGLFFITIKASKKAKAPSLKALALDHISDVLVSIALIIGVIAAINGYLYFEPIASIVVAVFILYNGIHLIKISIGQVVDEAANKEMNNAIKETAERIIGVKRVDVIKTRKFGLKLYVDIEIAVEGSLTVDESHDIAEKVHLEIENVFDEVKHCMVHVNPY